MVKNQKDLNQSIEQVRDKLVLAQKKGESQEEILRLSKKLDKLILSVMKNELSLKNS